MALFWIALFVMSIALQYVSAASPRSAIAADGDPTVVLEDGVNGCMGVRTTPGSENTNKELIGDVHQLDLDGRHRDLPDHLPGRSQ